MGGPGGLSRARRLCHWGPLVALAVVAVCSATAMADAALWYWPLDTTGGSVNFIMLLNWTVMILYNYFSAMFVGPGYVPLGWTPVSAAFPSPRPRAGLGGAGAGSAGRGEPAGPPCRRGGPCGGRARRGGEGGGGCGSLGAAVSPSPPGEAASPPPVPPRPFPLLFRRPRSLPLARFAASSVAVPPRPRRASRSAAPSQPGPAAALATAYRRFPKQNEYCRPGAGTPRLPAPPCRHRCVEGFVPRNGDSYLD